MNDFVLRELEPAARDAVSVFFSQLGEESASFFNVDHGNERRVLDWLDGRIPACRMWAAFEGGVIASLMFMWDLDTAVPWFGVAVRDDYQGRGLGSFMVKSAFRLAEELGCGGILLDTSDRNVKARRLYEKYGFIHIGTHPSGEMLYIKRFAVDDNG